MLQIEAARQRNSCPELPVSELGEENIVRMSQVFRRRSSRTGGGSNAHEIAGTLLSGWLRDGLIIGIEDTRG